MSRQSKYLMLAFAIVASVCVLIFVVGVGIENEAVEDSGIGAMLVSIVIFAILALTIRKQASIPRPASADVLYHADPLPPVDRDAIPQGQSAPLVEIRHSQELTRM